MDIKIVFSIASILIGIIAFYPYLKDIIAKKTKPHVFTWLIWSITQGVATVGLWVGGGGIGSLSLTIGTLFVMLIFFLSLSYGTRNISKSDIFILLLAFSAIPLWYGTNNALLAVILVSSIDVIGYIPTFRKSYHNPWSETAFSWGIFALSNIFAILAFENYNLLTMTYILSISLANTTLVIFLLIRRKIEKNYKKKTISS